MPLTPKASELISQARKVRDDSLSQVQPPLKNVPSKLPKNVMSIAHDVLTAKELQITSYDAPELIELMKSKTLSCEEVTRAFLRRAALAQSLVNCITELLPERAIAHAQYLDSLTSPAGALHGLPISIKEHHGIHGCSTNGSYVAHIGRPQPTGPISVNDALYAAGCVFYARTTQPQAVMHLETSTNIYGVTTNPHNTDLTPGGSSGGESALIALHGSVLGVGGDIGGSIRNPAACTGVYGFKPTPGRIGKAGGFVAVTGQEGVMATQGPLSTSRSGLNLFMETYLASQPWIQEDNLVPLPWRSVSLPPVLRIGVMWDDGVVRPHPPVLRALREVVKALEKAGHEVVDWVPEGHDTCWDITQALYWEDGGKVLYNTLAEGGEDALPLTDWLVKDATNVKHRTVEEIWELKTRRNAYRARYNALWLSTQTPTKPPIHALLCPTNPGAAPPHGSSKYWSYTSQWNILEYPGAVFPVTVVDPVLDSVEAENGSCAAALGTDSRKWCDSGYGKAHGYGKGYEPRNESDRANDELWKRMGAQGYQGVPIGLQVVARKWEDEICLAVLAEIEKAMGRE